MLLIDKPSGITSFDVVDKVKKITGEKKVGHTGTLDPLASGLLIVLVGRNETKKQNEYMKKDKKYEARIIIGQKYDTLDVDGTLEHEKDVKDISRLDVENALSKIVGSNLFEVPKYSAIKLGGKRLYKLARSGIEFKPPTKKMNVFSAELFCFSKVVVNNKNMLEICVKFHVSSGTYIRTLANEIGKILKYPASILSLRRTSIGEYNVSEAISYDDLESYLKG